MEKRPVILLVEDEILIRMATADALRDEGYEVVEAANGDEALIVLTAMADLHLVITDIRMPGSVDGIALTATVKDQRPWLPVLVISSHLTERADCRHDRFLTKPFRLSELLDAVAQLIGPEWQTNSENRNAS